MGSFIAWFVRLFVSNPPIIIGILFAAYHKFKYNPLIVEYIFKNSWVPYVIMAVLGVLYTVLFKRIYNENTRKINWMETLVSSWYSVLIIALAAVISFIILYAWDYAFTEELDNYLRYKKGAR